jgi:hypothetical protein
MLGFLFVSSGPSNETRYSTTPTPLKWRWSEYNFQKAAETIIFFPVQHFLQKISLYSCPRVATVKLSSSYRPDTVADTRTPGEVVFRYSCLFVSYMFYCACLHTRVMYNTRIILYTIPSSRLRITVGVCPYDGNIFVLKYHKPF